MMIKNSKDAIERIDSLANIGKAGNEGIFIKFKLIDLSNYLNSCYKEKKLELFILLTTPLFYDYIYRDDTKTSSTFKSRNYEQYKSEYRFVRNLYIHSEQLLEVSNYSFKETKDYIQINLESDIGTIFVINLSSLNTEVIEVNMNKITIKKQSFIIHIIEVLENFLEDFLCSTNKILIQSKKDCRTSLSQKEKFLIKVLKFEILEKSYINYAKNKFFFNDKQDYYDTIYLCFILMKLVQNNTISIEGAIEYLTYCIDEDKIVDHVKYSGNAYYSLTNVNGESLENDKLINIISKLDYYFFTQELKSEFHIYLSTYEVELTVERNDLYKNYYVNALVSELNNKLTNKEVSNAKD